MSIIILFKLWDILQLQLSFNIKADRNHDPSEDLH